MKKIIELEEIINQNEKHKKSTETKYNELVETHNRMFGYIEKLEIKVKRFQERGQRRKSYILGHVSTENSLSINYRINDESKSDLL